MTQHVTSICLSGDVGTAVARPPTPTTRSAGEWRLKWCHEVHEGIGEK